MNLLVENRGAVRILTMNRPEKRNALNSDLTRAGEQLYRKLINAAAERNGAFLGCLSAQERACLEQAMTKLAREARSLIQKEQQAR